MPTLERETIFPDSELGKQFLPEGPGYTTTIGKDGNCFFRCVSWHLTGIQTSHAIIRKKICDWIEDPANWEQIASVAGRKSSGANYLLKSGMRRDGKWATEVELTALARWSGQDVYTFCVDKRYPKPWWAAFYASGHSQRKTNQAFYLLNDQNEHFEPIVML